MSTHRQYPALDIAKYIGAMLVVAIHTFPFVDLSPSFNLFFISTVCRLAVPFFFVCSCFFLFGKISRSQPEASRQALIRYEKRLGILYLIWTVIYIPYTLWNYSEAGFTLSGLLGWIRDFFLNGSYYHLWFLPALMLGVWIIYTLYMNKGLKSAIQWSLILYLTGWLINIFGPFWETVPGISMLYGFFVKLLGTARDGIFFAPVFVVLGLLVAKRRPLAKRASALCFAFFFVCLILEVTLYAAIGVLNDKSCMFLCLIPCLFFLMHLLVRLNIPDYPVCRTMRKDSTLIYVSHILFARLLLAALPNVHLVVYLGTLACSQIFSSIIVRASARWPQLKWLM